MSYPYNLRIVSQNQYQAKSRSRSLSWREESQNSKISYIQTTQKSVQKHKLFSGIFDSENERCNSFYSSGRTCENTEIDQIQEVNQFENHIDIDNKEKQNKQQSISQKLTFQSEEVSSKSKSESTVTNSDNVNHLEVEIGQIFKNKYKVIKHLGDGTFGRVVEVQNLKNKQIYAMKIIRAVKRYVESAKIEADIIQKIHDNNNGNSKSVVNIIESFAYGANYCIIFEKLGLSLYDFLEKNNYQGYPIDYIQSFFKSILQSLAEIHSIKLTHTDLKPENILLKNGDSDTYYINNPNDNNKGKVKYLVPKSKEIKLIDFGGATFDYQHHSSIINTRQYRAPEVIMQCCKWNELSDLWCVGCIILELYSGDLFFSTHNNLEHIAMIEKVAGSFPREMIENACEDLQQYFDLNKRITRNNKSYYIWPNSEAEEKNIENVKNQLQIDEIISSEYKELRDLLKQILEIDPKNRISAKQALKHPFFKCQY